MAKKITTCGLLIALAFVLSYLESLVPIPIGIPGIKLHPCYQHFQVDDPRYYSLYRRIGMVQKEMPEELRDEEYPGFLYFEIERGAPV